MAKKQKNSIPQGLVNAKQDTSSVVQEQQITNKAIRSEHISSSFISFSIQAIILAVVGLIFYFNTFHNEFALDDRPIIIENEFVQQGIAGIPKIISSDAFASYLDKQNSGNALTGGRYRPLSIITFAIEQQILGLPEPELAKKKSNEIRSNVLSDSARAKISSDMHARHITNVLLYILSVIVLLYFLRNVLFPENNMIPFIAALLFLIHPIHTEVVANVKSRDEIMSLLFICGTFIFAFRNYEAPQFSNKLLSYICFFLALLSKEYALTLIVLLPLALYLLKNETIPNSFKNFIPFLIPLGIYILLRVGATSNNKGTIPDDIMNIPYLYATAPQKIASIIATLFSYIQLLFIPHPLASDYSYNQIPYRNFASPMFWLSLVTYATALFALVYTTIKRHKLAFALAFYLLNLFLVSNILINIGAPMGERLIYHSSLGFVIILAWGLYQILGQIKIDKVRYTILGIVMVVLTICSGYITIARNKDWKNDKVLYMKDIQTAPSSCRILSNTGSACIDNADNEKDENLKIEWYNKGIGYLNKAITINPKFASAYENRGICYYKLGNPDKAVADWDSAKMLNPANPNLEYLYAIASNLYFKRGIENGKVGKHEQAVVNFRKAAHVAPNDAEIWFNIGFASFSINNYQEAADAFNRCATLDPKNVKAKEMADEARRLIKQVPNLQTTNGFQ